MPKKILSTASFLRRAIAFIIDLFILNFFIAAPFRSIISRYFPAENSFSTTIAAIETNQAVVSELSTILFLISLIALIYFSVLEWKLGQTIGQMILSIYSQAEKGKMKLWQTIISNVFIIPFFPFFLLWVIDPLYLIFRGKRLTEKIAGTKIVQEFLI